MKEFKILVFELNKELYATDIMEVERILGYEIPTQLPESPEFLDGVIKYEDGILPIINLANKFKLKSKAISDENKLIVIKKQVGKFAILVDSVCEVININEEDIDDPRTISTFISQKYIKGLVKKEKKIIIILDLSKILTEEEEEAIVF
ncbi:chemotaxis protein CheW [Clostridium gasigenes]|uniref:Purine-binding chemotaxis protein CheW n=1 Tax=Clostridium gasigenes TaxID=94869 RepID=A0A7X0VS09_9CLOT|nr:chemotaxis protein CheW [Clostridium gasigenes]MBB6715937.1 purine-binding chemotaxis protein CheW [Clostridium gasigenes]MBU3136012.1 chemotaxis protein CheW [Clostridium gasigenes]NKF06911.1 purine-binding chemotaxis protein CheW [Clostridium gasigenes]QSW19824.1 purine-binding chemotaxis protein CheW [Clostridium gasigenes]